jgi:hypothetical protein
VGEGFHEEERGVDLGLMVYIAGACDKGGNGLFQHRDTTHLRCKFQFLLLKCAGAGTCFGQVLRMANWSSTSRRR